MTTWSTVSPAVAVDLHMARPNTKPLAVAGMEPVLLLLVLLVHHCWGYWDLTSCLASLHALAKVAALAAVLKLAAAYLGQQSIQ